MDGHNNQTHSDPPEQSAFVPPSTPLRSIKDGTDGDTPKDSEAKRARRNERASAVLAVSSPFDHDSTYVALPYP